MKSVKRVLLMSVVVLLVLFVKTSLTQINAENYSGSCGESTSYSFDPTTGVLSIYGTGSIVVDGDNLPWGEYSDQIVKIDIGSEITEIGDYAFCGCVNLNTVIIPDSLCRIGRYAFTLCDISSITIPERVTCIGEYAFSCCNSLRYVLIGDGCTTIESGAFYRCNNLSTIVIGKSAENIATGPDGSFLLCGNIESITISQDNPCFDSRNNSNAIIRTNSNELLFGCKNTIIPESITRISDFAFADCYGLTSVIIPDSVIEIGEEVFQGCGNLKSVCIGASLTSIDINIFDGCYNVETISISQDNPYYDSRDNCNAVIETGTNELIFGCCNSSIPETVTSIGISAFENCENLTSITIPNSITSIGNRAFYSCRGLTSIILPESITEIKPYAFGNCESLKTVNIPNTVTSIGEGAFLVDSNLNDLFIPDSVVSIGRLAFSHVSSITLNCDHTKLDSLYSEYQPGASGSPSITVIHSCELSDWVWEGTEAKALFACTKDNYQKEIDAIVTKTARLENGNIVFDCVATVTFDGNTYTDTREGISNDHENTYAVLTSDGDLVFFRSLIDYNNGIEGRFIDVNGVEYNGTIYSDFIDKAYTKTSPAPWTAAFSSIKKIKVAQNNTIYPIRMDCWFRTLISLTECDLRGFSGATLLSVVNTFEQCTALTTVNLTGFDTSNIQDFTGFFSTCTSLKEIDVHAFNTSSATNMQYMFFNCTSLLDLETGGFDTSNVTNMTYMFNKCSSLNELDLSSFNTAKVANMNIMFNGCTALRKIMLGPGFTKWFSNGMLPSASWHNAEKDLTKTSAELQANYPSNATEWSGTWEKLPNAYAVLQTNGDLVFLCSYDSVTSGTNTIITDINGVSYSGYAYTGFIDQLYSYTYPDWHNRKNYVKNIYVAENNTIKLTSLAFWFADLPEVETISFAGFDGSAVTDMTAAFWKDYKLKNVDFNGLDTSNVTNMYSLFGACSVIEEVDFSPLNLDRVTNMKDLLSACPMLKRIDISSFNTTNIEHLNAVLIPSLEEVTFGPQFTNWFDESLPEGMWCNVGKNLSKTSTEIKDYYPANAEDWSGTWIKRENEVTSVSLNLTETHMYEGDTLQLNATVLPEDATVNKVVWSTNHPEVVEIIGDGTIRALSHGTAIVKATAVDGTGIYGSCTVIVDADYSFSHFIWTKTDNGYSVVAEYIYRNNPDNTRTVNATVSSLISLEPTCTAEGRIIYTALVDEETSLDYEEHSENKEEVLPIREHVYSLDSWSWDEYSSASASFACDNCGYEMTVIARISSEITTEPTCGHTGLKVYTATVSFNGNTYNDQKTEVLQMIEHDYGTPIYQWSDDYSSVTATVICQNDATHVITETVETTLVITATCEEDGYDIYTANFENELFSTQTKQIARSALGHAYGNPVYDWADDHSSCTGRIVCANDVNHTHDIIKTVNATRSVIRQANCTGDGLEYYTAVFTTAPFTTQTLSVTVPALGHDYQNITYQWQGYSKVTANAVCSHDNSHVVNETVDTVYSVVEEPSCTFKGTGRYTASFESEVFEAQIKDVDIPALGHNYHFDHFNWSSDLTSATAVCYCANDPTDMRDFAANVTVQSIEATCEGEGKIIYTASFTNAHGTNTEVKEVVTAQPLGHAWGKPTYTWNDGYVSATARSICGNDTNHILEETKESTRYEIDPATCEGKGIVQYIVIFDNPLFSEPQATVVECDPLGHDWIVLQWTWDGYSSAFADFVCQNDNNHTTSKNAVISSRVTTQPTCTETGIRTYTATIELDGKSFTDEKTEVIAAHDHHYIFKEFEWSNNYTAKAVYVCTYDNSHQIRYTARVTSQITKQPGCETTGIRTYTASYNGYTGTKTQSIPATGHTPGEPVIENAKDPGCTVDGYYDEVVYCSVCGKELSRTRKTTPALGHDYHFTRMDWSGYTSAKGVFTCGNNNTHVKKVDANITTERIEPTYESDGSIIYTATVVFEGVTYTDTKSETILRLLKAPTVTTAVIQGDGILVEWDAVDGATGYVIYRRAMRYGETEWTAFARWNNTKELSFYDTRVYLGTKYQYGVKAYNGNDPQTITHLSKVGPMSKSLMYAKKPEAPKLTYTENTDDGIYIEWDPVEGATGYIIYRRAWSSTTGGWTTFERWNNTKNTSWTDTKVYAGSRYQYGIKAYLGNNPQNMKCVGEVGPLDTNVRITKRTIKSISANGTSVTVKWDASNVFTGYWLVWGSQPDGMEWDGGDIYINDKKTTSYTVNVNYCCSEYAFAVVSYHEIEGVKYYGQQSDISFALTGHQFGTWSVIKQATFSENGIKRRTCSSCGYYEEEIIPKTSETFETDGFTMSIPQGWTYKLVENEVYEDGFNYYYQFKNGTKEVMTLSYHNMGMGDPFLEESGVFYVGEFECLKSGSSYDCYAFGYFPELGEDHNVHITFTGVDRSVVNNVLESFSWQLNAPEFIMPDFPVSVSYYINNTKVTTCRIDDVSIYWDDYAWKIRFKGAPTYCIDGDTGIKCYFLVNFYDSDGQLVNGYYVSTNRISLNEQFEIVIDDMIDVGGTFKSNETYTVRVEDASNSTVSPTEAYFITPQLPKSLQTCRVTGVKVEKSNYYNTIQYKIIFTAVATGGSGNTARRIDMNIKDSSGKVVYSNSNWQSGLAAGDVFDLSFTFTTSNLSDDFIYYINLVN